MTFRVKRLLEHYKSNGSINQADKLLFTGVGDRDVYNITAPFLDQGEEVIAGRVEGRDTENSDVIFFIKEGNAWRPREGAPVYNLQDPFVTEIHGQLVFGGVKISRGENGGLSWKTVFYKGSSINGLQPFTEGPQGMKDIRLVELENHKIGVFTRPQGEKGGRGKIGYTEVERLEQLTPLIMDQASLVKNHFSDEEWGGANELYLLKNGVIGVLGHIACFADKGNRNYYPFVCRYCRESNKLTDMRIIAARSDFPEGEAKRSDLRNVLFSGGMTQLENGQVELYVGVSDAEAHKAVMPNPFDLINAISINERGEG
ncbi:DUF1861 family protein [Halobacillus sp. A5]|uniref:DUF1861 family protein n=1 Tax=Halobacillus sp. A5 TaxID=2880263 RepID=UPI0020A6C723|nr:DUF1861 family protein [Halobacillus sp. A5]MCP3027877.1 DUF1861 family protein [Halobacillus sp. A5]